MENKKRTTGFTLIELLVTIAILSLILIVGGYAVITSIEKADERKNAINSDTIKKSALQYVKEFRTEEKYWFVERKTEHSEKQYEYACTTVGMLINKGILKDGILGTKVLKSNVNGNKKYETIEKNTSVQIRRDANTKVYAGDIQFNSDNCITADKENKISISYRVEGTHNDGYNDWYNNNVKIYVFGEHLDQIENGYSLNVYKGIDNDKKKVTCNNCTEYNAQKNGWYFEIPTEGEGIKVCLDIYNAKTGKNNEFCLTDDQYYNMDKTNPRKPIVSLNTNTGYNIVSSKAEDENNITSQNKLKYYISVDGVQEATSLGSASINKSKDTRTEGLNIQSWVTDKAGNKSAITSKNLKIDSSKSAEPITDQKWYCSLDDNTYTDSNSANNSCNKTEYGTVSTINKYKCSLDSNKEYDSLSSANNKCSETNSKTVNIKYYCNGVSNNGSTCYKSDTKYVNGGGNIKYKCQNGNWQHYSYDFSDKGCPSGYSKDSYTCEPYDYSSCSPNGSTKSGYVSCTNTCIKKTSYSADKEYYCSLTEKNYYNEKDAKDACTITKTGEVSTINKYKCSYFNNEYSSESDANNVCYNNITGNVTTTKDYYCELTNSKHDDYNTAKTKCTNYCKSGKYFNGGCYEFN